MNEGKGAVVTEGRSRQPHINNIFYMLYSYVHPSLCFGVCLLNGRGGGQKDTQNATAHSIILSSFYSYSL